MGHFPRFPAPNLRLPQPFFCPVAITKNYQELRERMPPEYRGGEDVGPLSRRRGSSVTITFDQVVRPRSSAPSVLAPVPATAARYRPCRRSVRPLPYPLRSLVRSISPTAAIAGSVRPDVLAVPGSSHSPSFSINKPWTPLPPPAKLCSRCWGYFPNSSGQ